MAASSSDLVTTWLDRAVSWSEGPGEPMLTYGPGQANVPAALAEHLQERGFNLKVIEYKPNAGLIFAERVPESQELAPDFPFREYLFMSGDTTYGHVAELSRDQLLQLPGIGASRADQILAAMEQVRPKMPGQAQVVQSAPVQPQVPQETEEPVPDAEPAPEAHDHEASDGAHTDGG